MCGIVGYLDLKGERPPAPDLLGAMMAAIAHRGPDAFGEFIDMGLGLGFQRLAIVDLLHGGQPMTSEDGAIVMICNGEIFNHRELRRELATLGHRFRSDCDVEVILHLYEEEGMELLGRLNGQFSFALYDRRARRLFLARDHAGITPLFYTEADGRLLFGSEIKALLQCPLVERTVDLVGLDQIISFPGLVSPRTMFGNIRSLKPGHYLDAGEGGVSVHEYWDLSYPVAGTTLYREDEREYLEEFRHLLTQAVRCRMMADVPVGVYLSGGLDSSLIASLIRDADPGFNLHSFSITFPRDPISEQRFQDIMAERIRSRHHVIPFDWEEIAKRMASVVYHAECPLKETYDACSMALSEEARGSGVRVVLGGEGADELFAGYPGYRFDCAGGPRGAATNLDAIFEEEMRRHLWGGRDIFYERDYHSFRETRSSLFSEEANAILQQSDAFSEPLVDRHKLEGRHPLHQRSYLDVKLRLADHLLGDHGDRMAMANAVEGRYPFLDQKLVEFVRLMPPELKLKKLEEKYAVKRIAEGLVPRRIIAREKFGFRAPGSPHLLGKGLPWLDEILSRDVIQRQGYFNPDVVDRLKARYAQPGFSLHPHLEDDLLLVVATFGIMLEMFGLPSLG